MVGVSVFLWSQVQDYTYRRVWRILRRGDGIGGFETRPYGTVDATFAGASGGGLGLVRMLVGDGLWLIGLVGVVGAVLCAKHGTCAMRAENPWRGWSFSAS